jgi:hypothetical protein
MADSSKYLRTGDGTPNGPFPHPNQNGLDGVGPSIGQGFDASGDIPQTDGDGANVCIGDYQPSSGSGGWTDISPSVIPNGYGDGSTGGQGSGSASGYSRHITNAHNSTSDESYGTSGGGGFAAGGSKHIL